MTEAGSIVGTAQYLVAGAGARPARRAGVRPLLGRRRAVRDAHRPGAVHRRLGGRDRHEARAGAAGAAAPAGARDPAGAGAVVLRAMAKDPSRRYHSADEMGMDLDRVRKGLALTGATVAMARRRRDDGGAPPPPPTGAYPVAPVAAAAAPDLAVGGGADPARRRRRAGRVPVLQPERLRRERTTRPPPRPRPRRWCPCPNVIGFPTDGAVTTLQNAGFKVAQAHQFSSKPKDTVIKTDPVAQTPARAELRRSRSRSPTASSRSRSRTWSASSSTAPRRSSRATASRSCRRARAPTRCPRAR